MDMKPKNKKGAVVTSTIMGIGGLIIGVIVILVITSTLLGSNLFTKATTTQTETTTAVNSSGVYFGDYTEPYAVCSLTSVGNSTGSGNAVPTTNYSLDNCLFNFTGEVSAPFLNTLVNITSTTTYPDTEELATKLLQENFTSGIDNVSQKIPTILLIVAVVFLFGALVLLVRNAKSMSIGGGGSL